MKFCETNQNRCAIILAGGDGTRLSEVTRRITGEATPKQFCPVIGTTSLLEQTRLRVSLTVHEDRILTVLTRTHERHYRDLFTDKLPQHLVIQPEKPRNSPCNPVRTSAIDQSRSRCVRGVVSVGSTQRGR